MTVHSGKNSMTRAASKPGNQRMTETGKKTIAEFAENSEIITMLKGMGIDYAQGYGVSEPKAVTRAVA